MTTAGAAQDQEPVLPEFLAVYRVHAADVELTEEAQRLVRSYLAQGTRAVEAVRQTSRYEGQSLLETAVSNLAEAARVLHDDVSDGGVVDAATFLAAAHARFGGAGIPPFCYGDEGRRQATGTAPT
ncbi:hypothetical protein GCM10009841_04580 [Microlunatus panaciterrae]|uniref:Uncharacterized protein n=1 Tax=Microlunatus panaciterrae TaxID=400768 RepID=A0ABS2RIQ1_9ACTN|nr:hypothetical protein [Microlunatus panaciterrae]MBM7798884.1 hypothetical protein [Microlunatus panaciterrae]